MQRQLDIGRERTHKGFPFIGFLDMIEATGTEMGTRKKSKQRLYDYYFDSPWCPLFGSLLDPNYLPNSTVSKAVKVIEQARLLWDIPVFWCDLDDIEICHMYVEPEAFSEYFSEWTVHYPHYPGFKLSKELLISARRVFWEGINISTKAQLAYSESHPIWDKDKDGNPVEYLAPDQAGSSRMMIEVGNYWGVSSNIEEWQVYGVLAISWAHFILQSILQYHEPEDDPKMVERLRIATSFLTQATGFKAQEKVQAVIDDEERKKTENARQGGYARGEIYNDIHEEWKKMAHEIYYQKKAKMAHSRKLGKGTVANEIRNILLRKDAEARKANPEGKFKKIPTAGTIRKKITLPQD